MWYYFILDREETQIEFISADNNPSATRTNTIRASVPKVGGGLDFESFDFAANFRDLTHFIYVRVCVIRYFSNIATIPLPSLGNLA